MNLKDVSDLLGCEIVSGQDLLGHKVEAICAADLMSDVLAFTTPGSVLLTGLTNVQSVNTAHIAEVGAIVYVRGKKPDAQAARRAQEIRLPLLSSPLSMYEACGRLYEKGLSSGSSLKER